MTSTIEDNFFFMLQKKNLTPNGSPEFQSYFYCCVSDWSCILCIVHAHFTARLLLVQKPFVVPKIEQVVSKHSNYCS